MQPHIVRPASETDNAALIELERLCPQGTRLRMYSERDDYFFRARLYGDAHTLVVEDRGEGRIFGVLGASMKDISVRGERRPAAFFYDLRLHPDYRKSVRGRFMLTAWKAMERWAGERGAHLIYGLVKKDNAPMTALVDSRMGYRFAGGMMIQSRPVFRRSRLREAAREIAPDDARLVARTQAAYGRRDFFPVVFRDRLLTPAMEASGLFSFLELQRGRSWASIGMFRASRVMRTRIVTIPGAYKLLQPLFSSLSPLVPLPRIPREGGSIGYCHVFNHLADGPEGTRLWRQLIAHANNAALEDGADLLTSAFDPFDAGDGFHAMFRRGAMNTIEYRLGIKALVPDLPAVDFSFYPDVRDMN